MKTCAYHPRKVSGCICTYCLGLSGIPPVENSNAVGGPAAEDGQGVCLVDCIGRPILVGTLVQFVDGEVVEVLSCVSDRFVFSRDSRLITFPASCVSVVEVA